MILIIKRLSDSMIVSNVIVFCLSKGERIIMGKDLKGKELGKGIRQRKDGRYEARLKVNGVEQQIYSNSLTEIKKEYIKMKKASEESLDYKKQGITLNEWFNEWFDTYKAPHIKSTSIYPMKSKYNNSFGKIIGDKKLAEIRNMDIQNVINQMQSEGRAVSSMRDALGRVRECMESAKNNRIITINPCFDITIPWEKKAIRRRFLSKEEQNLFLKIASDKWYKEMFYIMFLTGLRVGELGGLMWKDINWETRRVTICHNRVQLVTKDTVKLPKREKVREIELHNAGYTTLKIYKEWQEAILGRPVAPEAFVLQWEINLLQDYVCHTGKVSRKWKEIYHYLNKCRVKAKDSVKCTMKK